MEVITTKSVYTLHNETSLDGFDDIENHVVPSRRDAVVMCTERRRVSQWRPMRWSLFSLVDESACGYMFSHFGQSFQVGVTCT